MTYKEIQELNAVEPFCFEDDTQEQWYKYGLAEGAKIGYEQALNDAKKLINQRYELHNPEYLKTRSAYLEGLLDGLDDAEQDIDELLK